MIKIETMNSTDDDLICSATCLSTTILKQLYALDSGLDSLVPLQHILISIFIVAFNPFEENTIVVIVDVSQPVVRCKDQYQLPEKALVASKTLSHGSDCHCWCFSKLLPVHQATCPLSERIVDSDFVNV